MNILVWMIIFPNVALAKSEDSYAEKDIESHYKAETAESKKKEDIKFFDVRAIKEVVVTDHKNYYSKHMHLLLCCWMNR